MGTKINSLFKSRRFWVAVAGVVIVASETVRSKVGITPDQTTNIVLVLGSWIVGDSLRVTD
tara:strand:- start:146 stop:328 length:183 start_codon:yes stop_codon:yes gene_type:complete